MPKAANKKPRLRNLLLTHQKNAEANRRTEGRKNAVRPSKRSKTSGSGFHTAAQSVPAKAPSKGKQSKTIPYSAGDRILMIGEGNFSFALALLTTETIKATPSLLVATSYDSQDECYTKYPDAQEIVSKLRAFGATVLFGIDATKLDNHEDLLGKAFDRISFNFPHAGAGIKDQDRNILANQKLIVGFFQSCAPFLARGKVPPFHISQTPKKRKHSDNDSDDRGSGDDESSDSDSAVSPNSELQTSELLGKTGFRGSVLITLRNSPPYTLWYEYHPSNIR
ncbi:uncharacterized protein EI90DRAFT_3037511 [Cantharellus anzutake]|uniref:uncharacterized protein n=1 Tax=Cantharellus anzutake TaxID=1750568 RepID=UPI001904A9EE|nr:uncharacterized protein EI90DRAFT_3037511 [Cantharellus anzutake]KAF8339704.1 hypothetical protein EI90DRAFT_3037511 [Cantharellus anzutake]